MQQPESNESTDTGLKNFKEMRQAEIENAINVRRAKLNLDAQCKNQKDHEANKHEEGKQSTKESANTYPDSDGSDLVGLALSGGGIRSAMFNLGLLQAMQRAGFLKHVDYISSVSGGGYTNGYYSTLGGDPKTASTDTKDKDKNSNHYDKNKGLSAKDAQFLLDGQYLNRPTEFMTDYLLKTALLFGTVFASVIFIASMIAIYFRFFDFPSVRRWLVLLDLNSDLRVGIFASVVLIVAVLVVRGVYRGLRRCLRVTPTPAPGRWAVIAAGIMLLGCAVMIGNGDFFVSDQLGFLPEKIDLKSLQIPIAVIVAMLFLPLLRVGSLIRSEKINSSLWQRLALWVVLSGATWGSLFVAVGYLGQENLSGFVSNRPPHLENYDVFQYERLAGLMDDPQVREQLIKKRGNQAPTEDKLVTDPQIDEVENILGSIRAWHKSRNKHEMNLRRDNEAWKSWLDSGNSMIHRWIETIAARTRGLENDALCFINSDHNLNDIWGPKLLTLINESIKPTALVVTSRSNVSQEAVKADRELTKLLLNRAARKVASRTQEIPEQVKHNLLVAKEKHNDPPDYDSSEETQAKDALEIFSRWVSQGAPMARKSSSDPVSFRDISELRTIMEVLTPSLTNHNSYPSYLGADKQKNKDDKGTSVKEGSTIDKAITRLTPLQHWKLNRLLLEVAYPEVFKERRWISTSVTIFEDQDFRWTIMMISGIVAAIGILMVDINHLSPWFLFYRKRVHETFLRKAGQSNKETPLHELDPCKNGYPYPLFVGGLILPHAPAYRHIQSAEAGKKESDKNKLDTNINPSKVDGSFGSLWYSFLMSPLHVGWMQSTTNPDLLEQKTYRCTKEYLHGGLTVSDAIVLSGAAVSTFMASNPALRVLLQVFNIRLEQWLPNPVTKSQPNKHQSMLFGGDKYVRFNTFQLFTEWLKSGKWSTQEFRSDSWGYGVVADGGFREFLGVEELVARRCKIIVASDAGCNNGLYEFGVLADLIRKLRLDHDVEILDLDHDKPLDTKRLVRIGSENSLSPQHYIVGRIKYPKPQTPSGSEQSDNAITAPEEGLFVYLQMSLTGDEDIDIAQFKKTNPQFPDEPISNQFYSKDQVESFRQLGEHIGKLLCWDVDAFDCPSTNASQWRIETLDSAFREAYRSECRQESMVATDDARIGWLFDGPRPNDEVENVIKKFESPEGTDHQILIRNFVWHCVDGYHEEMQIHAEPYFDFKQLKAADLYGIAIESNRRHSGFRPEWPTAFFQINGRDLLMRATQRAHELLGENDGLRKIIDIGLNPNDHETQKLIKEFSRLAVMLPRAVFRLEGVRTATDVLICLIRLGLSNLQKPDAGAVETDWTSKLLLQLRSEPAQRKLRRAVQTGNPLEVEAVLHEMLNVFFSSTQLESGETPAKRSDNPESEEFEATPTKPR